VDSLGPLLVPDLTGVVAVDTDGFSTCAVRTDGSVWCWGAGGVGQLGQGDTEESLEPVEVPGITSAEFVNMGNPVCAGLSDGNVRCWGAGWFGMGDEEEQQESPVAITSLTRTVQLEPGLSHACALLDDSTVHCWGTNTFGEAGLSTGSSRTRVGAVSGVLAVEISTGGKHSCARLADGSVKCWGANGWLDAYVYGGTPVNITGITGAVDLGSADYHSCAVQSDGLVKCWGGNLTGALGNGNTTASETPVNVLGLPAE
jgi:alpha-tubulin suppressor-like RCC1 family protein